MAAACAAALAAAAALAQAPVWRPAAPGRPITLPADHASHPEYRLEWWYYTGNLDAAGGRRFGYQLTFFRVGVDPAPSNPSRWAVRDLFMAHLALTDTAGGRFQFSDRLNRAGPGWAGAETDAYRVWNEDWSASLETGGIHRLKAATAAFGLDLRLTEDRPPVLHGERGFSRKAVEPGHASHYYSLTRMPTRGTLRFGGLDVEVTGRSWMDHEFGSSFLHPAQIGWDWFSIQFDDGRDLMLFQLRRADGSIDPQSSGTLVEPGGTSAALAGRSGLRLEPGRTWRSAASGARYPVAWTIRLPALDGELAVSAALDDQELRTGESTGIAYWEGAIDVSGRLGGRPVKGRGYLEMTGYAGRSMGGLMR
jgi:predicted secreted hydrolase